MTCGESRFVFTVINALCHSLKTIKEAEVFPFFFSFSSYSSSVTLEIHFHCIYCTQWGIIIPWFLGTVVGICGRQFTQ